jgi:hypothetical protein
MELARLEPATSWVRFGRAPRANHADLQGFWPAATQLRPGQMPLDWRGLAGVYENRRSGANPRGADRPASRPPEVHRMSAIAGPAAPEAPVPAHPGESSLAAPVSPARRVQPPHGSV